MKKLFSKALAFVMAGTMALSVGIASKPITAEATVAGVSVHDPSVVKGDDGYYYIFGSHMAWAKSKDMVNWTTFKNNINTDYKTIFANAFDWSNDGDSVYNPSGNLWAPDVIYNKALGKWTMYMSINGCSWNSTIVLLTADKLDGDWTYVGPVVYSGFTNNTSGNHSYTKTDYTKVTGDTSLNSRYTRSSYICYDNGTACTATTWNTDYGAHAIDPSVKYDEDGNLWMSYGSWSGGIYLLKLDLSTGLRDYTTTYSFDQDVSDGRGSDPYMGYHIGGGVFVSGEASYLIKIGNYWYMFVSYGGFSATGGYNMRLFRSEKITGPYVDQKGNYSATSSKFDNVNSSIGYKVLGNYQWTGMTPGEVAQGHNSALVDSDGRMYLVYHTRYNNDTEWHNVRVHEMFMNEDGWPVVSGADYKGEVAATSDYSVSSVAGQYGIIYHTCAVSYNATAASSRVKKQVTVNLNADGTISGAYSGTWSINGQTIAIKIGGNVFKGHLSYDKFGGFPYSGGITQLNFTASTNNMTIWGRKTGELSTSTTGTTTNTVSTSTASTQGTITAKAAGYLSKSLTLKKGSKFKIKASASNGSKLAYASSNKKVASVTAKGLVKAKKVGKAKITVSAPNCKSITYTVKVVKKAKKATVLKLKKTKITLIAGNTAKIPVKKLTNGATTTYKFKSNKKSVATVDSYGVIKAKKKGKAVITVKNGKAKAKITVNVIDKINWNYVAG